MQLLEREADLAALKAAFDRAKASQGGVVLVAGEAGIGKSTLVEYFADSLGAEALILRGHCDPLVTPSPLAPLRDIALQMKGDLPGLLESRHERATLFSAVLGQLLLQAKTVLLVFEDIHWADEATLAFVRYLGRRIGAHRLLLVATYRDDEVDHHAMLRALLGSLANERAVERRFLSRLSLGAVRKMARGDADAVEIHQRTGGNPFFVRETVSRPGERTPTTVRDAVLARADQLEPGPREFLEFAAVVGARLDAPFLATLPPHTGDQLAACIAHGLLVSEGESVVFRHAIIRDAILETLNPIRRRTLSRAALAACIPVVRPGRSGLAQLAELAEDAGDREAVIRYAGAAAEAAAELGAHREAHAQYARIIRFGQSCPALIARSIAIVTPRNARSSTISIQPSPATPPPPTSGKKPATC